MCALHLFFLLTWSQEVSQTTQKAPHALIMHILVEQLVKRAEELENRLAVADHIIRDQFLRKGKNKM